LISTNQRTDCCLTPRFLHSRDSRGTKKDAATYAATHAATDHDNETYDGHHDNFNNNKTGGGSIPPGKGLL
jgi:hypothetical protein